MQIGQKTRAKYEESQRAAKLRSILAILESLPRSRPVTVKDRWQRLERVRTEIINFANNEFRARCCCLASISALGNDPDAFEAEMNRPCLVHGRRNLGCIVLFRCTIEPQSDLRLLKLVRQYYQSRAKFRQANDVKTTKEDRQNNGRA